MKRKQKWKQIISYLMIVVMLTSALPTYTKAASAKVSVECLGNQGTVTCGSKTKSGKWWKMKVNRKSVFCMDLGNT
mgnify:FL=1